MICFDKTKSLQELEHKDWGEPNFDSHLVQECHRLHLISLKDFTIEDLRIMIGQNIGLDYLVPLAVEKLQKKPLSEGAFYPGDLLVSILRADLQFWLKNSDLQKEVTQIAERAFAQTSSLDEFERLSTEQALKEANDIFNRTDYLAKNGRS